MTTFESRGFFSPNMRISAKSEKLFSQRDRRSKRPSKTAKSTIFRFLPEASVNSMSTQSNVSVNSNWVHPPGQPRGKFFERANPGHPGKFFCLIPYPGAKNDGRIPPGMGQNFPKLEETAPY